MAKAKKNNENVDNSANSAQNQAKNEDKKPKLAEAVAQDAEVERETGAEDIRIVSYEELQLEKLHNIQLLLELLLQKLDNKEA
jgi:hypothetical protein